MMDDKVARPSGPITFAINTATARPIKEVVIFRNNRIVHTVKPGANELDTTWTDESPPKEPRLWYYMRVQREDN